MRHPGPSSSRRRRISIVIPCLNEEENLAQLLTGIRQQESVEAEVIVVDGGSADRTPEIARAMGASLVTAERGRGSQMNEGARRATHDLLCFLHADSRIDDPRLLIEGIESLESLDDHRTAGHFALRFLAARRSLGFHHYEEKSKLNRQHVFGGDQGLLIRRAFFDEIGGFDESFHFLEDKQIGTEILRRGRMVTLPGRLGTSTRRFENEGFARRMLLTALIMGLYEISYRPFFEEAERIYRDHDQSSRLNMHHFFRLIHRTYTRESLKACLRGWYGIGRYVRINIWQAFAYADSCLSYTTGSSKRPFLAFHDRVFLPLTDFALFSALVTGFVFVSFYVLWLYYWIRDEVLAG